MVYLSSKATIASCIPAQFGRDVVWMFSEAVAGTLCYLLCYLSISIMMADQIDFWVRDG